MTDKPTQEITLPIEQANKLIELCENPPEPTEELKAAARKYKELTNMTDKPTLEELAVDTIRSISYHAQFPLSRGESEAANNLVALIRRIVEDSKPAPIPLFPDPPEKYCQCFFPDRTCSYCPKCRKPFR